MVMVAAWTWLLQILIQLHTVLGVPTPDNPSVFWREVLASNGTAAFNDDDSFKVFRNVRDYGAKGDGQTFDDDAIKRALSDGPGRIYNTSSTTSPVVLYFPAGVYLINSSITLPYYTTILGSAIPGSPSILKASETWPANGWMLDNNPYQSDGQLAVRSTNNFYKEIRDFEFDLTLAKAGGAALHWPASQANLLQNIQIRMSKESGSEQVGIFCESGSGGFMSDIIIEGGSIGLNVGSQQFVSRGLHFKGCEVAINQLWDWTWVYQGITIEHCGIGLNMSSSVGSVTVLDSVFLDTPIAISTPGPTDAVPTAASIVIDSTHFLNSSMAVKGPNGILLPTPASGFVTNWIMGRVYNEGTSRGDYVKDDMHAPEKDIGLLEHGAFLARSRPNYREYSSAQFVTVKSLGAQGNGLTDDTLVLQKILDQHCGSKIVFFDAGAYIISDTLKIPAGCWIVGEGESVLMVTGPNFADSSNPKVAIKIGETGDTASTQLSGLLISNRGGISGAILLEWNVNDSSGRSGIWTTHARIGGALGTQQTALECSKVYVEGNVKSCSGPFLKFHVKGAGYFENMWIWTADHQTDRDVLLTQANVYTGRGLLVETTGPSWFVAVSSEHSAMYNYQINTKAPVFFALLQSETPYYQPTPTAPLPFTPDARYSDPQFSPTRRSSLALRVLNSTSVLIYGSTHYSFFSEYDSQCIKGRTCQFEIVSIEHSTPHIYNLATIGSTYMLNLDGRPFIAGENNLGQFGDLVAAYLPDATPLSLGKDSGVTSGHDKPKTALAHNH